MLKITSTSQGSWGGWGFGVDEQNEIREETNKDRLVVRALNLEQLMVTWNSSQDDNVQSNMLYTR